MSKLVKNECVPLFQMERDARLDLLQSLRLYEDKRHKAALLRGYMQAAKKLLQNYE